MQRKLGPFEVEPIGLGCMNLSHAYGAPPPPAEAERVLLRALELGVVHFDTAALYGFGANEELVGRVIKSRRESVVLASKCGMTGVDGKRVIDGRPQTLKRTCEESLRRLQTDVIDLYYLHRWDKRIALEESVGALGDLVAAGKVRAIGLSEVSAASLRKAHAVHPIAAVQSEYSLFTRNPELAVLDACKELGAAFVAFSPLSRGLLAGAVNGAYEPGDIRRTMPRFNAPHLDANLALACAFKSLAQDAASTPAQLALAWLLDKHTHIIPIPGTTSLAHLEENIAAQNVRLSSDLGARMETLINAATVQGPRYGASIQAEIDTEEFAIN